MIQFVYKGFYSMLLICVLAAAKSFHPEAQYFQPVWHEIFLGKFDFFLIENLGKVLIEIYQMRFHVRFREVTKGTFTLTLITLDGL